jgi:hypothetical protein
MRRSSQFDLESGPEKPKVALSTTAYEIHEFILAARLVVHNACRLEVGCGRFFIKTCLGCCD